MHQSFFFFFNDTATTEIYTLSLHDALPIFVTIFPHGFFQRQTRRGRIGGIRSPAQGRDELDNRLLVARHRRELIAHVLRSEEHTSELQSPCNLVCRLLLEKKKNQHNRYICH